MDRLLELLADGKFVEATVQTLVYVGVAMTLGGLFGLIIGVALTVTRGKRAPFTVQPLPDAPAPPPIPTFKTEDEARTYWMRRRDEGASPDELQAIQAAAPTTPTAQENA